MAYTRSLVFPNDILHEIFRDFSVDEDDNIFPYNAKMHRRTLSRCARVCKAFNGPALDHLWGYLETSSPLLEIMPCVQLEVAEN